MPAIPPVSMPVIATSNLTATGKKDKVLGYACELYEIQERGETMDICDTDSLIPFHPYRRTTTRHFGAWGVCDQVVCPIQHTPARRSGSGGTLSMSNTSALMLATLALSRDFAPSVYSVGDQQRPRRFSVKTSDELSRRRSPSSRALLQ